MSRPLRGAPIAVIDFETTGIDPLSCMPVSVAVVHCDLGETEPQTVLNCLINPGGPIPEGATEVHGITDADVAGARSPEEVCAQVSGLCDGRVIVAYNLPYDLRLLRRYQPGPFEGICAYVMAKAVDKFAKGKKLIDVAGRRGITFAAHDAGADALTTAQLLPMLLREIGRGKPGRYGWDGPWCKPEDLQTVEAFWRWTVATGAAQERDLAAYFEKQGKGPLDSMPWSDAETANV